MNRSGYVKIALVLALVGLMSWLFIMPDHSSDQSTLSDLNRINRSSLIEKQPVPEIATKNPDKATIGRIKDAYGKLPLSFEANRGQTDSKVKFLSRGNGYNLFLTSTEAVLALTKGQRKNSFDPRSLTSDFQHTTAAQASAVLRMKLVGAEARPEMAGIDELPGKTNYLIGNDPAKWRTNISNYAKVKFAAVYPGVDLVYYGNQRQLEYDFVVAPGASPKRINLSFEGAQDLRIDKSGDLVLQVAGDEIVQHRPFVYQVVAGEKREIAGGYLINGRQVGFEVGSYDESLPLVIDPTLVYSTFLGGNLDEFTPAVAVDSSGNAFIAGGTLSANFPTTAGANDTALNGPDNFSDAFVTKLNPTGTELVYSTYFGGTFGQFGGQDGAGSIAIDSAGNAYFAGGTCSDDLPIVNGFQSFRGGNFDGFVAKLNPAGSMLLYSSYLGGGGNDGTTGIAADNSGNAYVSGTHNSGNSLQTTANAFQQFAPGGCDGGGFTGFVARVNTNASGAASLVYSSHIGGDGINPTGGIALDSAGNVYVAGTTSAVNFPTSSGAYQTTAKGSPFCFDQHEGYLVKLNTNPSTCTPVFSNGVFITCAESRIYATYLGGSSDDGATGVATDSSGNAYVIGVTNSGDFPTTAGAPQSTFGGGTFDVFMTKLNSAGSALVYSTYLGGSLDDESRGIAVDSSGNAYVTGFTSSTNFPTADALQSNYGGGNFDAFVTELNSAGTSFIYSTYLGGSLDDRGNGIAVKPAGNVYVAGTTSSLNFQTTPGAFQTANAGLNDAFVVKIGDAVLQVSIDIKPGSFPNSINLGSNGVVPVAIFSTASFDARTVDPLSVKLSGANVKLKGNGTPQFSFQDVNKDGLLDMVIQVSTEALQLSETDTQAVLTGQTFSGMQIRGVDSVRVVP